MPPTKTVPLSKMVDSIKMPAPSVPRGENPIVDLKSDNPVLKFGSNSLFRPNVAAHVFNERGEFMACLRMDGRGWQCVQGGVEKKDKDIQLAALRELEEEVGLTPESGLVFVGEISPPSAAELAQFQPKSTPTTEGKGEDETSVAGAPSNDADAPDWRYFRYNYPGFNPRRTRLGQEQRQMLYFLPSVNISKAVLTPDPEKFGPKVSQEFLKVEWMSMERFFPLVGAHKEHIFAYVFLKAKGMIQDYQKQLLAQSPATTTTTTSAPQSASIESKDSSAPVQPTATEIPISTE